MPPYHIDKFFHHIQLLSLIFTVADLLFYQVMTSLQSYHLHFFFIQRDGILLSSIAFQQRVIPVSKVNYFVTLSSSGRSRTVRLSSLAIHTAIGETPEVHGGTNYTESLFSFQNHACDLEKNSSVNESFALEMLNGNKQNRDDCTYTRCGPA